MADIYTSGGDFLADGSVRAFTNPRYKPTGGVDVKRPEFVGGS